ECLLAHTMTHRAAQIVFLWFLSLFRASLPPPPAPASPPPPPLPARSVHLAVATAWPSTPAEFLDVHDLADLTALLETYLQGQANKPQAAAAQPIAEPKSPTRPAAAPGNEAILKQLIEAYGVSGGHGGHRGGSRTQQVPPRAE